MGTNSPRRTYAGVELGGTKCVALLARGPGDVLARETLATAAPKETLDRIAAILSGWEFDALGIASFGPLDLSRGRIAKTPKPGWAGTDLLAGLRFAGPVAIDTDVNAAALAEMRWGAGRGLDDFAYVTVGTGVGVGLIANGVPTRGFGHCELGHIRVPRLAGDEFAGSCPFHGDCVEGLAAGPSLVARAGAENAKSLPADDPVWDSVVWALAQLCHAIVCAAAPRIITIGGGVVENNPHLLGRIEAMLVDSLNGFLTLPQDSRYIVPPALGRDSGPLGAIALAMNLQDAS